MRSIFYSLYYLSTRYTTWRLPDWFAITNAHMNACTQWNVMYIMWPQVNKLAEKRSTHIKPGHRKNLRYPIQSYRARCRRCCYCRRRRRRRFWQCFMYKKGDESLTRIFMSIKSTCRNLCFDGDPERWTTKKRTFDSTGNTLCDIVNSPTKIYLCVCACCIYRNDAKENLFGNSPFLSFCDSFLIHLSLLFYPVRVCRVFCVIHSLSLSHCLFVCLKSKCTKWITINRKDEDG